jgi:hypothetical protein
MVIGMDVAAPVTCETGPVNRTEIAALLRATSPPPRLSRWAWTADAILAFALTVGTTLRRQTACPYRPPLPVRSSSTTEPSNPGS